MTEEGVCAESSSPIVNDLHGEIHRMLREGRSHQQIIDFMVARNGDFVLYDPPTSSRTAKASATKGAPL
ncbi:cytochrome c-type biogenesis protein [Cupriavidus sp. YR651]|uniref:cytochrome c-type biogenesis protein n=1 Tax=Cupriavidus sp. YR651 TaxID=1855315 RepID=UPI002100B6C1|nr:cytochrome c-type biogenesis protein CcmH [Cupriavidus sp. YR651]